MTKGTGPKIALAISAGYLLGRLHKMRWALTLAAAGAAGRLGTSDGLREKGQKLLENSELGDIADSLRSGLFRAGKAAAATAVRSRLSSLSDSLRERSESMRDQSEPSSEDEESEAEEPDEEELNEDEQDDAEEPEDNSADDAPDDVEEPEERPARKRTRSTRSTQT